MKNPGAAGGVRRAGVSILAAMIMAALNCGASAEAPSNWSVRCPQPGKAIFRAMVDLDGAGVTRLPMMVYPAPNAIGFIAALVTHSVLNETAKQRQKGKLQSDADALLESHAPGFDSLTIERLFGDALDLLPAPTRPRLIGADETAVGAAVIETSPVFLFAEDRHALVLDSLLRLVPETGAPPVTYPLRVVSDLVVEVAEAHSAEAHPEEVHPAEAHPEQARPAEVHPAEGQTAAPHDERAFAERQPIAKAAARLLAESIAVALWIAQAESPPDEPARTFRFRMGDALQMERAQLLQTRCDRLLLRTLRGHLMSVPVREPHCPAPAG